MKQQEILIKCPYCNQEYLPSEIFLPDSFLGKPKEIIRDEKGKIIFYSGDTMDLKEEFECVNCNKKFKVSASVKFLSEKCEDDFNEDYFTTIYKNRISLEEPK